MSGKSSWFVLFLLVAGLILGCGSNTDLTPPISPVGSGNVSTELFGRATVQPFIVVEEPERAEVASLKAELEASGFLVATDGSLIADTPSPAGYWIAEFGDQRVRANGEGIFKLVIDAGSPSEGRLRHPSDSRIEVRFFTEQLVRNPADAPNLVIPFAFPGPCGMSAVEDGNCNGLDAPESLLPPEFPLLPRLLAEEFCSDPVNQRGADEPLKQIVVPVAPALPTDITTGPRGTYGNVSTVSDFRCEDKNGPLGRVTSNKYLAYLGSTCDSFVKVGCCPNENAFSDLEYNAILAANPAAAILTDAAVRSIGLGAVYLSGPLIPDSSLDCPHNHKGRSCQHVKIGDLSAEVRGVVTFANDEIDVNLCPGEKVPFIIHNNGCFGLTFVEKSANEINGTLSSANLVEDEIRHYDPITFVVKGESPYPKYVTDVTLEFAAPADAVPGTTDTYEFAVDGKGLTINFTVIPCSTPPTSLISVGPSDTISAVHQVGSELNPCPQEIGTLEIRNNTLAPVEIEIALIGGHITTDGPLTLTLLPNEVVQQKVFFDCSTTSSFQSTIRVRAVQGDQSLNTDVTVDMTVVE